MGRFPWTNNHTKVGSDHKYVLPQEWFGKSNVEPSRQALNDLMKEHKTSTGDRTSSSRTRSRSNTAASGKSYHTLLFADVTSPSREPISRNSTADDNTVLANCPEDFVRSLSFKGSLRKRQRNKPNLLPSQVDDSKNNRTYSKSANHSASNSRSSTAGFNSSPQRSELTRNISAPFLSRLDCETNEGRTYTFSISPKFDSILSPEAISVDDSFMSGAYLDNRSSNEATRHQPASKPHSPTFFLSNSLTMTSPKPQPPRKDSPKAIDVRLSRSMENFSRPTRSPVASFDASQPTSGSFRTPLRSPASTAPPSPYGPSDSLYEYMSSRASSRRSSIVQTVVQVKPLPHLPNSIHAVSTVDDTAIPMRSAPLPMPLPEVPEEDELSLSGDNHSSVQRQSLRHVQTFPSSKASKRRSKSASDIKFDPLTNESTCTEQDINTSPTQRKRISIGLRTIPIDNWEAAIDYSWDHLDDLEDDSEAVSESIGPRTPPELVPQETYLTVTHLDASQRSSSSSSPLTMYTDSNQKQLEEVNRGTNNEPGLKQYPNGPPVLQGLGIESFRPMLDIDCNDLLRQAESKAQSSTERDSIITAFRREPNSPLSRSSSRESILLSIASSILDTHRSSRSSASLSDFVHIANFEDNMNTNGSATTIERPLCNSSDASQETIKTTAASDAVTAVDFASSVTKPLPPISTGKHERFTSASTVPFHGGTSAFPYINSARDLTSSTMTGRQRSATINLRSRYNTRPCYSLFPTVQPTNTLKTTINS